MGLTIICSCSEHRVSIGYATFYQFRQAAARVYGYEHDPAVTGTYPPGCETKDPVLFQLLSHSDCDGTWTALECAQLLPLMTMLAGHASMQEAVARLVCAERQRDGSLSVNTRPGNVKFASIAERLGKAMQHCVEKQHVLEFK